MDDELTPTERNALRWVLLNEWIAKRDKQGLSTPASEIRRFLDTLQYND